MMARSEGLAQRVAHAFAWVLSLLALALVIAMALFGVERFIVEPRAARLHEALRGAREAHEGMLDEETALRAWLITRDAKFLDPMRPARGELSRGHDVLDRSMGADPQIAPMLLDTRLAEQAWETEWARLALDVEPGWPPTPESFLASGKALFDAYRARQLTMQETIIARSDACDALERRLLEAGAGVELPLLVGLGLFARRQRRMLRVSIERPLEDLLGVIARLRDGDLEAPIAAAAGPLELQRIAEGLRAMSGALADERVKRQAQERRLRTILDATRELAESLNLRYVLASVARGAAAVASGPVDVDIWLAEERERLAHTLGEHDEHRGLVERGSRLGKTIVEPPPGGDPTHVAIAVLPMVVGARVVGVLVVTPTPGSRPCNPDIVSVLETLANHSGAAIESARLHAAVEERSRMDALTRLYNRRRLDEDLADECQRTARYGRPLSVVMMDVDHFKSFNDGFGHAAGDAVLQHVAEVLRGGVRATDGAYRYGGEEFALVLRETGAAGAAEVAERLRAAIEAKFVDGGFGRAVTASFGVAQATEERKKPGPLVEAADRALYAAKRAGRNRVVVAGDETSPGA
jgi:diguanylate cyclase (GGDEF)-like protein